MGKAAAAATDAVARGVTAGGMIVALFLMPAPVGAQFSAQPVILELRGGDSTSTTAFAVRNDSDGPLQLRVYAGDFDQPPEGGHTFLEPGAHPRSCVDRLQFYPDNLLLAPLETGEVRVLMQPGDATCWSMIFVQSVSRGEAGIQIAQRIGIKVYGSSARVSLEGEIVSVAVGPDPATGGLAAWIAFENTGEAPLRPEGELELRTERGDVVAVVPVAPFSVLPGRVRRTVVPLNASLPPGRYMAIPVLDFGAEYLAGAQALFEVGA